MRAHALRSYRIFALGLLVLAGDATWAQTVEKDRRIEEEKREDLKPTVTTPAAVAKPASPSPPVPQPLEAIYFVNLSQKRIAFRYDAAKSIVILLGVDEEYIDLASQVRYLQERRLLPKRFQQTFDPMEPLRKGVAAYLFYRALVLDGGLALHLFGPTERYTLQELVFQGIMSPGHVNDLVSGQELVQIMSQAASYLVQRSPKQGR